MSRVVLWEGTYRESAEPREFGCDLGEGTRLRISTEAEMPGDVFVEILTEDLLGGEKWENIGRRAACDGDSCTERVVYKDWAAAICCALLNKCGIPLPELKED